MMTEISVIGTYPDPDRGDARAKITRFKRKTWQPDTNDYRVIARRGRPPGRGRPRPPEPVVVFNLPGLMAEIAYERRPGRLIPRRQRLRRINLFAHGNDEAIGLCGQIVPGDVDFARHGPNACPEDALLTENFLRQLAEREFVELQVGGRVRTIEMRAVRRALTEDARFYVYSCRSGQTPTAQRQTRAPLLTALGRLLSIGTVGFLHDIDYGVKYPNDNSGPERWTYELCHPGCTTNFYDLEAIARAAGQLIESGPG